MSFYYNLLLVRTRPSRVNLCKLAGALVNQGEDQNFLRKYHFASDSLKQNPEPFG